MDINNETCVQKIRFIFDFYKSQPLNLITKSKNVKPEAVRNLSKYLANRLDRIALMMETLMKVHDNWAIKGKKNMIIMETDTFDFNAALNTLKEKGFKGDEFVLKVEYTRKWGLL
ncbi:MAG: hypothetical protein JG764_1927 [Clostridiales bacterium]|jgi:hypothetical protein|nr:hypothetical protein [Clostridiales bacterium]